MAEGVPISEQADWVKATRVLNRAQREFDEQKAKADEVSERYRAAALENRFEEDLLRYRIDALAAARGVLDTIIERDGLDPELVARANGAIWPPEDRV